ncbi:hypothetical protein [Celeribacter naphthalenivorans]|uniref:hypothetical protein n=1 Tax=Celeribacter naphthalenivorans TaxID=1614694 RepID=UPI001CFBCA62|nr:hypothetical protein [Celeribacter naphthalenivorans]
MDHHRSNFFPVRNLFSPEVRCFLGQTTISTGRSDEFMGARRTQPSLIERPAIDTCPEKRRRKGQGEGKHARDSQFCGANVAKITGQLRANIGPTNFSQC